MYEELVGKRIAWVLPAVNDGSGGLQTIFRHVMFLKSLGARCEIHLAEEPFGRSRGVILSLIERSYGCAGAPLLMRPDLDGCDVAIATMNITAKYVLASSCPVKCYFVQDFEPWFYPMGDAYLEAEMGYAAPLRAVTIGRWLEAKLSGEYGMYAAHTDFCADASIYHPLFDVPGGATDGAGMRGGVCAIYQPAKDRRCASLMRDALRIVHELRPDVSIVTYGSQDEMPGGFADHRGLLSKRECNRLYNESAVGLCISSSNPSRVPFEMMAAGLPVVDVYRENNFYDFDDDTVLLALPRPDALASAAVELLDDEAERSRRSRAGIELMKGRPADLEGRQFADALCRMLAEAAPDGGAAGGAADGRGADRSYLSGPVPVSASASACYAALVRERVAAEDAAARGLGGHFAEVRVTSDSELVNPIVFVWCLPDQSDMQDLPLEREDDAYVGRIDLWRRAEGYGTYNFHLYADIDGSRQILGAGTALLSMPEDDADLVQENSSDCGADGGVDAGADTGKASELPRVRVDVLSCTADEVALSAAVDREGEAKSSGGSGSSDAPGSLAAHESSGARGGLLGRLAIKLGRR